jgi:hypothetical protein
MIETRIIEVSEISNFRKSIVELFQVCFSEELDQSMWEWAYLKNPTGNPIIAIALDKKKVVGHYAMIPMPFLQDGTRYVGYLSMTTMVHPSYRKFGLFLELASLAYSQAIPETFVYGFPNSNSAPGFKKRLDWKISDNYQIATVDSGGLIAEVSSSSEGTRCLLDLSSNGFRDWRLSKPNAKYYSHGNLIYKEYNGEIDILNEDVDGLSIFHGSTKNFNLLTKSALIISNSSMLKEYKFGYRNFSSKIDIELIRPNLLMSDVF